MSLPEPPILLISDRKRTKGPLVQDLRAAVDGGCRWIMLREKDLPEDELSDLVRQVQSALANTQVSLLVNAAPNIVAACGLAGVHLPAAHSVAAARQGLGPSALIGQSAHSLAAVLRAADEGADYATISPIFDSISKDDTRESLGSAQLRAIAAASPIPVIALGGVASTNAGDCRRAGAAGIAVLGAVMGQASPGDSMAGLLSAWREAAGE